MVRLGADPVIELNDEVVGRLIRAKLQVDHSVHPQLGHRHEASGTQVLTQLKKDGNRSTTTAESLQPTPPK